MPARADLYARGFQGGGDDKVVRVLKKLVGTGKVGPTL